MMVAAKTLAMTGVDLLLINDLVEKSKKEWLEARGSDFIYIPIIGDRIPALDYRD